MALAALSLPGELQRFMDRALRGEIEIRVRNLDENARLLYYSGQQLLWGMLARRGGRARGAVRRARPAAGDLGVGHRRRRVRPVPGVHLAGGPPAAVSRAPVIDGRRWPLPREARVCGYFPDVHKPRLWRGVAD